MAGQRHPYPQQIPGRRRKGAEIEKRRLGDRNEWREIQTVQTAAAPPTHTHTHTPHPSFPGKGWLLWVGVEAPWNPPPPLMVD